MENRQTDIETSNLPPGPEKTDLSEREIEILRLLATGVSNKEIAQKLFISPNTVKVHLRNIFGKIGAASRTEATLFAIRTGLVVVDTPAASETPTPAVNPASIPDSSALLPAPPITTPARRMRLGYWIAVGTLGGLLLVSPFLWRVLMAASFTPTAQASTPVPSPAPRWQASAEMPIARRAFAVAVYENQIYAIGGETAEAVADLVTRYDPATNRWHTLNPKPAAVADVNAALVGGHIYVPGGRLATGAITSTVEVYNPTTDKWEERAPLPVALSAYALAAYEGRLYLFGGWDGATYRADVFAYDPEQDEWTTLEAMPTARGHAGAVVAGDKIYVMGGTDGSQPLAANEEFDPNGTPHWQMQAALPVGRARLGIAAIANSVYLVGGEGEAAPSLTLQYSPAQDGWQAFEAPPGVTQWTQPGLAVLNGQILYVFGGQRDGQFTAATLNYQAIYTIVFPFIK